MFFYMLAFGAGYFLGSGGKLPPQPSVHVDANGNLVVSPPTTPNVQPQPNPSTGAQRYPLMGGSFYVDTAGNIFDSNGKLVAAAGSALASAIKGAG